MENLRSVTASPASVMGTPPRHPGSATAELPRRVIRLFETKRLNRLKTICLIFLSTGFTISQLGFITAVQPVASTVRLAETGLPPVA